MKYFFRIVSLIGLFSISQLAYPAPITDTYTTGDTLTATTLDNIKAAVNDNDTGINALSAVRTGYLNIPAAAFVPTDNATDYDNEGGWNGSRITVNTGSGAFVAAVYLPNAATITGVTYSWYDADAGSDMTAFLRRVENRGTSQTLWTTLATTASSGSGLWGSTSTTTIATPAVDNNLYSYYVYVNIPAATSTFLYGYKITYTYSL